MNFNVFYYETCMEYGKAEDNPRYVLSLKPAHRIVYAVAKRPDYYTQADFGNKAGIAGMLIHIGVLREIKGKLRLDTPVFLKKDARLLKSFSKSVADKISSILYANRRRIYGYLESISSGYEYGIDWYHLICGYIFDGRIPEDLEEASLASFSNPHANGMDYIPVLYENTYRLNRLSRRLYCSYNRYGNACGTFQSFGDDSGNRRDFYRYRRLMEENRLSARKKRRIAVPKDKLAEGYISLLKGEKPQAELMEIYTYFGYAKKNKPCIPVYEMNKINSVLEELYGFIKSLIENELRSAAEAWGRLSVTPMLHAVESGKTANEVYHCIFGYVNRYCVRKGLAAKPLYRLGEGRYLKSFELYTD